MTTLLLIYSHIGALTLGMCIIEIIATRKSLMVDLGAILFISVLWPWAFWLMYQKGVKS